MTKYTISWLFVLLLNVNAQAQCGCDVINCNTTLPNVTLFQIYYGDLVTLNAPPLPPNNSLYPVNWYCWFKVCNKTNDDPNNPTGTAFICNASTITIDPLERGCNPNNNNPGFDYFTCRTGSSACTQGCPQCFYGRSFKVVYQNIPAPSIINPPVDTVCLGSSILLRATKTVGTLEWYLNSTTGSPIAYGDSVWVTPSGNSVYYVRAHNGGLPYAQTYSTFNTMSVVVNATASASITGLNSICNGQSTALTASGGGNYAWSNSGGSSATATFSPTTTTTYTVTVTSASGCTATASRTVTVNASPTAGISPATSTICAGESATLTASGGTKYNWSSGDSTAAITKSPTANTTYTVTVTNANNCTATASRTVTVNANPTPPQVGSNSPVNAGGSINLTASTVAGATYTWTGPNGFTSSQQNPVILNATTVNSGNYSLVVTVNGCSSSSVATSVVVNSGNVFTLYIDTVIGVSGQQAVVTVRVKNFTQMLSAQTTLQFNPAVLSFVQAEQFGISSLGSGSFGTTQVSSGILTFAWSDPNVTGITLTNGSALFALRFNVIGSGGQFSAVNFTGTPTPQEFVDVNFNTLTSYVLNPGRVNIPQIVNVSGRVKTETGAGVRSAQVDAVGSINYTQTTNLNGNYSFTLPQSLPYTVTPTKTNDTVVTNGVSTLDVLLIQRHILGTQFLPTPYRIIAADVNNSSTITTLDVNLVNAFILGNITKFPNNKLWSFVPHDHVFANLQNPFPFPSLRSYSNVTNLTNQDFIGMKLGDVNNSYNSAVAKMGPTDSVVFYLPEMQAKTGDTVAVPIKTKLFNKISGFQMALQWDSTVIQYIDLATQQSALPVNIGSTNASQGVLSINWFDINGTSQTLNDDTTLFVLRFKVTGATGSQTPLTLTSLPNLPMEAYDDTLGLLDVTTNVGSLTVVQQTSVNEVLLNSVLVSAMPNPFTEALNVHISGTYNGQVKLQVSNVLGQLAETKSLYLNGTAEAIELGAGLAAGTYYIKAVTADGQLISVLRVVKQR